MRRMALLFVCLALAVQAARAADGFPPGKLYIKGEGQLLVPYDMTKVSIRIEVEEMNDASNAASLARSKHEEATQSLLNVIEGEIGIPLQNITTTGVQINPLYNYSNSPAIVVGYEVTNDLELHSSADNTGALPKLYEVAASVNSPADNITASVFGFNPYISDELREASEEALFEKAMAKASKRAQMYAAGAERDLGPVTVMSDTPIHVEGSSSSSSSWGDLGSPPPEGMERAVYADAPSPSNAGGFLLGKGQKLSKTLYFEYLLL